MLVTVSLLTACATAPKKSASESVGLPESGGVARSGLPPTHRKASPYAPAQEDPGKRGNYVSGGLYAPGVQDSAPDDPLHDVDQIPEPDVVAEPRSRYGNRPYTVLGKRYTVRDTAEGYVERGGASYYGKKFHGRRTSNLEVYDMYAMTAAHKTLPLPSFARVTNLDNGKSVVVRVNDRGPFHAGRIIDLSYAAAVKLGYRDQGVARVEVVGLSAGENARHREGVMAKAGAAPSDQASSSQPTSSKADLPPGVRIATGKPVLSKVEGPATPLATTQAAGTAMDKLVGMLPIASAQASERPPQATPANTGQALPPGVRIATGKPVLSKDARAAGGRVEGPTTLNQPAAPAAPTTAAAAASTPAPGREWRFDMQQDGKAMTADEFDAWMKSRRARVATGKAGTPDPSGSAAPRVAAALAPPLPQVAAATVAAEVPAGSGSVTLQVASFGNSTNAGHALNMLRKADIAGARIQDALVNGKQYWRVRVGPVDAAHAPELAARVVSLGFDQPHRVRE